MNELMEVWNSYPQLVELKVWVMTMSLSNIIALIVTVYLSYSVSMTVTTNGDESSRPKVPFLLVTLILLFAFPQMVWYATIPFGLVMVLLIVWQRPVFIYLNFFLPRGSRLKF